MPSYLGPKADNLYCELHIFPLFLILLSLTRAILIYFWAEDKYISVWTWFGHTQDKYINPSKAGTFPQPFYKASLPWYMLHNINSWTDDLTLKTVFISKQHWHSLREIRLVLLHQFWYTYSSKHVVRRVVWVRCETPILIKNRLPSLPRSFLKTPVSVYYSTPNL